MTRWWRWTLALLLCGVGVVALDPGRSASAAPSVSAGLGAVVADLGPATAYGTPGFSFDGRHYGYLVPAGDRCELHVYDLTARTGVLVFPARIACDGNEVRWAAHTDVLQWQVDATAGNVTVYVWDAGRGQVSVMAPDAHVEGVLGLSADGRFLAFTGSSDAHPAPSIDPVHFAVFVYDRTSGVSLPLSTPSVHVWFLSWAPVGHNFIAQAGGQTAWDGTQACFGSGSSCRVLPDRLLFDLGSRWSRDGTAIIGGAFSGGPPVYDFTAGRLTTIPTTYGVADYSFFVGADASHVVGYLFPGPGSVLWDRRTGAVSKVTGRGGVFASPTGRYLLYRGDETHAYRYRDVSSGADRAATLRGTEPGAIDGYWTKDGSSFVGLGPGGCSSLRQWSPVANTVSLFGPPGLRTCFAVPQPFERDPSPSSVSGRFGVAYKQRSGGSRVEYVADLRRHVLLGLLQGRGEVFAPAGSDLLAVSQPTGTGGERLLLVDPTPSPDVDDKPRWSPATPATGAEIEVVAGGRTKVQLGASDLQGTPVNLYFRWRDPTGTPIASAPKGWSCERKRLAAGATVADCTFAPPKDHTAPRFLDVSATNYTTGAQSDTRSYRVAVGS